MRRRRHRATVLTGPVGVSAFFTFGAMLNSRPFTSGIRGGGVGFEGRDWTAALEDARGTAGGILREATYLAALHPTEVLPRGSIQKYFGTKGGAGLSFFGLHRRRTPTVGHPRWGPPNGAKLEGPPKGAKLGGGRLERSASTTSCASDIRRSTGL